MIQRIAPLLFVLLGLPASAQVCSSSAWVEHLGLGSPSSSGPMRLLMQGSPVLGEGFGLHVDGGSPGETGVLLVSETASPTAIAGLSQPLIPGYPWVSFPYTVKLDGTLHGMPSTAALTQNFCGKSMVVQAFHLDPALPGLLASTQAWRIHFGEQAANSVFEQPRPLASPTLLGIALGDLDADGELDLASASSEAEELLHVRGRGDGTFGQLHAHALESEPEDVLVLDFDGDGKLDLVASIPFALNVCALDVLYGDGAGGLSAPDRVLSWTNEQQEPGRLTTADVDGNGTPDLLLSNGPPASKIRCFLNDGAGHLSVSANWPVFGVEQIALADVDGDGFLDVAYAHQDGWGVVGGFGDGSFGPEHTVAKPGVKPTRGIALGDLDLDGHTDALGTTTQFVDPVFAMAGDGSLDLGALQVVTAGWPVGLSRIEVSDLGADGDLDAVVACQGVFVARSIGSSASSLASLFAPAQHVRAIVTPDDIELADLDHDGLPEVLVSSLHSDDVDVLRNLGGLHFSELTPEPVDAVGLASLELEHSASIDVDGDGRDELLVGGAGLLHHLERDEHSGWGALQAPFDLVDVGGIATGDWTGDGTPDVAVVGSTGAHVLPGLAGGGLGSPITSSSTLAHVLPNAGDANMDGFLDLVTRSTWRDCQLWMGDGAGAFSSLASDSHWMWEEPTAGDDRGSATALVDVDLDGVQDLLMGFQQGQDYEAGQLNWRRGWGGGAMGPVQGHSTPMGVLDMEIADLDGDGAPDATLALHELGVWICTSSASGLQPPIAIEARAQPMDQIELRDFTGDGLLDLVGRRDFERDLVFAAGFGGAEFASPRTHGISWSVALQDSLKSLSLCSGDFDGDGVLGVAVTREGVGGGAIVLD